MQNQQKSVDKHHSSVSPVPLSHTHTQTQTQTQTQIKTNRKDTLTH